jgi:hypothetical protein
MGFFLASIRISPTDDARGAEISTALFRLLLLGPKGERPAVSRGSIPEDRGGSGLGRHTFGGDDDDETALLQGQFPQVVEQVVNLWVG